MSPVPDQLRMLDHVSDEIHELWLDRYVWQTLSRIAAESSVAHDSFIVAWVGEQYYRRAAIAVRAMVDRDPRSDSLINVLIGIEADPAAVPCHISDMRAAGSVAADPALVRADIDQLSTTAAQVRSYVNKYLAHIDQSPKLPIPAIAVVDTAVQVLGDLLKKYTLLLKNADLRVEPMVLFDWASVFQEPWAPPASPPT